MRQIDEIKGLPEDETVWVKFVENIVKYAITFNKQTKYYTLYIVENNKAKNTGHFSQSPYALNQYITD